MSPSLSRTSSMHRCVSRSWSSAAGVSSPVRAPAGSSPRSSSWARRFSISSAWRWALRSTASRPPASITTASRPAWSKSVAGGVPAREGWKRSTPSSYTPSRSCSRSRSQASLTSGRQRETSSASTSRSARSTTGARRSSSRAGHSDTSLSLATEVCDSTSKARNSSISSPNHSARHGRARSSPKTSTMPPLTAISPAPETALTRRYPSSTARRMKSSRAWRSPLRRRIAEPRTRSTGSAGRSRPAGDATINGLPPSASSASDASRRRVTSSDGGTRSNGGVSAAGNMPSEAVPPHSAASTLNDSALLPMSTTGRDVVSRIHHAISAMAPAGTPPTTPRSSAPTARRMATPSRRARSVASSVVRGTVVLGHGAAETVAHHRQDSSGGARQPRRETLALLSGERLEHVVHHAIALDRSRDADAHAHEILGAQRIGDGEHALLSGRAAAAFEPQSAERQVDVIVDDDEILGRDAVLAQQVHRRAPREVHVRLRPRGDDVVGLDDPLANPGRALAALAPEAAARLQLVEAHPAEVVPGARVLTAGVAEADHQCSHVNRPR